MSNDGSKGVVIITWSDVSDEKIKSIISNLYMVNKNSISGMQYYEVGAESSEMIKGISDMFEKQITEDKKERPKPLRHKQSLDAFL